MTMCDRCGNDDGKPTVNKGTFNFHVDECASKPPAPTVVETDTHEFRMEYARALKEFAGSDESMFNCGYTYGVIVGKRANQRKEKP